MGFRSSIPLKQSRYTVEVLTNIDAFWYTRHMNTRSARQLNTRPQPTRRRNEPSCAPASAPSLSTTRTESLASQLKALADPTRLRMLDLLAQQRQPLCVCDITEQFSQNQPTVSHHLKLLREAGLIETEKQGIWAFYWATEKGRECFRILATLP